jgi:thiamine-monophosphate kinase
MPLNEFELIERYFRDLGVARSDVRLGVGDDAALLECAPDRLLVAATDTLVEGIHFPQGSAAASIGHRALAVNLSDLAAMGAEPAWALLALTLPRVEERWLEEFSRGFAQLAKGFRVALVGGDTTRGPLCMTVELLGSVERGTALRRAGGTAGDLLFVSGTPGDAAAGLGLEQSHLTVQDASDDRELRERFLFPCPRVTLGRRLRDYASACIDVSDGVLADAGKLAHASGCGAVLDYDQLPVSPALLRAVGPERAHELALTGGDDYELLFSVPAARAAAMLRELPPEEWTYQRIGALRSEAGASVVRNGSVIEFSHCGFDHFAVRR